MTYSAIVFIFIKQDEEDLKDRILSLKQREVVEKCQRKHYYCKNLLTKLRISSIMNNNIRLKGDFVFTFL